CHFVKNGVAYNYSNLSDQSSNRIHSIPKYTAKETLNQFLAYFNRTWMVRFAPSLWNISAGMMNRTSNAHPNICSFVEIIKDEFLYSFESVIFRPIIRYSETLLEEFCIYFLNN
ncbi:hypothetical protein HZS_1446, partial [Henneguya salminicola]